MLAHSLFSRRAALGIGGSVLLATGLRVARENAPVTKPPFRAPAAYRLDAGRQWVPAATTPTDTELRAQFRSLVRCGTRQLHVSGVGSDANPGTAARPLRQISAAIARARPGDLIVVGNGTYGYTEVRGFRGNPAGWLGIMTASAATRAIISVPPPTDNFVNIIDSRYVGMYGFEVRGDQRNPNTNGSGISVYGNSHSVALWRNHVHDFPGGGINCFDVGGSHDLLDISFNTIHATSRYSPSNTSGISIYASRDLTGGATLPGGYGYRIVGNYVYDIECLVPFAIGGFDFVTDGNGISLDKIATSYGYAKKLLVAGNVITSCGGRGVLAYETRNVVMINNTAVGNLRTKSPGISGGAELEGKTDKTVQIRDNVICPLNTPKSRDGCSSFTGNLVLGGSQTVPTGNTDRRGLGLGYFAQKLSSSGLRAGPGIGAFRPAG